jgi:hypothetical protein
MQSDHHHQKGSTDMKFFRSQVFFRPGLLLAAVAFLTPSAALSDTVVLTSLGNSMDDVSQVRSAAWIANSFITDTNAWRLNSVEISMFAASNSSGNFFLSIWSDNGAGTAPGSQLEVLSGTSNPNPGTGSANFSYTAAGSGLSVDPTTKYWVVAGVTAGPSSYNWNFSYNPSPTALGVWSIPLVATYVFSTDQAATWLSPAGGDPYMFAINATLATVPEPSTWVMGLAGATCASWGAMRRRTRTTC